MPIGQTGFLGFPRETFSFLSDLSLNNRKTWFDTNKDRFRHVVEQPVQDFVAVMCARLIHTFKGIKHLEGKVFRIHRDIRFSKDKRPYKTHIGIRFSEDASKNCAAPFFYVQLEAEKLLFATGQKEFEGVALDRYRTAVIDSHSGPALSRLMQQLHNTGIALKGEQLQNIPRGYPADHVRADLLRFKGLYAESSLPVTEQVYSPRIVQLCLDQFSRGKPLYEWLKSL
ncbi:MAG: DUF2461 domain-containing protein [Nitrospira sp.]|nr:DUF2461 domain-containing protein [Nitrospira sp.]